jgi:hypothetical protein
MYPGAATREPGLCSIDADGDGWARPYDGGHDCEDSDPTIHPGAATNEPDVCTYDVDRDGWGDHLYAGHDCNDADPAVVPVPETCNGLDDDCSGRIDDIDNDNDGVTTCSGDCDDTRAVVYPGAIEVCDGLDNDCDPATDENVDNDGDGFTTCQVDCDDSQAEAYPGRVEDGGGVSTCDGIDNDCDGVVDEDLTCQNCDDSTYLGTTYRLCRGYPVGGAWRPQTREAAQGICGVYGGYLADANSIAESNYLVSTQSAIPLDGTGYPKAVWVDALSHGLSSVWSYDQYTSELLESSFSSVPKSWSRDTSIQTYRVRKCRVENTTRARVFPDDYPIELYLDAGEVWPNWYCNPVEQTQVAGFICEIPTP